jgi:hypothetical protein
MPSARTPKQNKRLARLGLAGIAILTIALVGGGFVIGDQAGGRPEYGFLGALAGAILQTWVFRVLMVVAQRRKNRPAR